jgi:hypothetical protein
MADEVDTGGGDSGGAEDTGTGTGTGTPGGGTDTQGGLDINSILGMLAPYSQAADSSSNQWIGKIPDFDVENFSPFLRAQRQLERNSKKSGQEQDMLDLVKILKGKK